MKVKIFGKNAQEIVESVRHLVNQGQLKPDDILPPVRALAAQLGVNRNTVSSAYQHLTKAGIAVTQGRRGTRICHKPIAGEQEGTSNTPLFDLADGSPRRDWLPDLNSVAQQTMLNQYVYGEATILPEMYTFAKQWFQEDCPQDLDITLCSGAIDTLERLLAAHLHLGDKVVVEDPCYISSANAIRLSGMHVLGATMDEQGMRPEALKAALKNGAKAVLVTPRAHNPSDASLSKERAEQLREVLSDYPNVLVMADDHFSLMAISNYYSVIPESTHNWAVFRSVSKGLGPDLRMALVAADKESIQGINSRLAPGMSWVSRVLQSLVYTCLTTTSFQKGLQTAAKDCVYRRSCLIEALAQKNIEINHQTDGLNVWVPIAQDPQLVSYALSRKGWLVRPGCSFAIKESPRAIRVSIQKMDEETAKKFVTDLIDIQKGKE
ncbi:aminotransferase class I/II-fold pyridoxal phosphate-dependent enzyme [Agaribacter flavus]|uniref:Aminotransferase class I/II-fold pyridoxal phosphate-dependent enzyme n=1 Tax=Agaribacter flavus TaxID=1902781 RepID=A0ABV7FRR0_9ALTE